MIPTREIWKWTWPRWSVVFPIDFMLSLAIMGLAAAVALVSYSDALFKAKLTEAVIAASGRRAEVVERLALSGDPVETPLDASGVLFTTTAEAYLSGQRTVEPKKEKVDLSLSGKERDEGKKVLDERRRARESDAEAGRGGVSKYVGSTRTVGNSIIAAGVIDGRSYEFALFPAVADEEIPSVYIWLCGRSRIPEGWLAQPPALSSDLPNRLQLTDCKRRRME